MEDVDPEIVVSILRKGLKDIDLFKKAMLEFIKTAC
jgi:hypothetical protein